MALEKTATRGIYKTKGKKGQVSYVLMYYVQAPDPLRESGYHWKPKGKRFSKYQDALDFKVKVQSEVKSGSHQESSDLTLEELAKEWLQSCRQDWKLQTFDTHSSRRWPVFESRSAD